MIEETRISETNETTGSSVGKVHAETESGVLVAAEYIVSWVDWRLLYPSTSSTYCYDFALQRRLSNLKAGKIIQVFDYIDLQHELQKIPVYAKPCCMLSCAWSYKPLIAKLCSRCRDPWAKTLRLRIISIVDDAGVGNFFINFTWDGKPTYSSCKEARLLKNA